MLYVHGFYDTTGKSGKHHKTGAIGFLNRRSEVRVLSGPPLYDSRAAAKWTNAAAGNGLPRANHLPVLRRLPPREFSAFTRACFLSNEYKALKLLSNLARTGCRTVATVAAKANVKPNPHSPT